jgi:GT2 family glycosyltransferase/glycosyltransferase involved in cell wall biosynthesis
MLGGAEAAALEVPDSNGQPPPAGWLQAYIDEVNPSRITGWLWNPQQPQQRIAVDVFDGDLRLMRVTADQYRSDLKGSGIGDGKHAFVVPLRPELLPNARNILHLRVGDTGAELPGSPVTIDRAVPPAPFSPSRLRRTAAVAKPDEERIFDRPAPAVPTDNRAVPRGAGRGPGTGGADVEAGPYSTIDFAGPSGIGGWIWNPYDPQQRIALELFDGDQLLTTVLANQYRADLLQAGIGDGCYGFSIAFSETLLPYARHVLRLRPAGTAIDLPSFPLVLTRDEAGLDPTVRFVLGNLMAEAKNARSTDELAPLVTALVGFLDAAISRYAYLAEQSEPDPAELLNPAELAPQFQKLVRSVQSNYPQLHIEDAPEPVVSIVIPVFNKFDLTYDCVKSIIEAGAKVPFEIVIADDCSRDETMLAGFAFGAGIRLVRSEANGGFVRSCNRGFDAARGEYVLFLNNDTIVNKGWLDELYETMRGDPQIGIAGTKLLYPDGSLQECGGIIWRLGDGWNWGRGEKADDPRYCYLRDADYVSGAALMIRAELFARLGRFDEYYAPMYYEDTDLCFRVRQAGYRVVVQPASEVVHFEGASAGTNVGSGMKRFQAINHRKFFERWKETLASHRFNGELPELEAERTVERRALFIDDSVPEPDKDAGSNAALQHMLSLQRLGYKLTFIPADNMARIDPYTADLQRRGIECLYHPFYVSVEDVFRKHKTPVDLVYLHRYSNASKYAGMVRQHFPKACILYNVADLHFLRAQRQAELEGDPQLLEKAEQLRRLELGAMAFVDAVIVHSAAEAELLREIAPDVRVHVIPWTVPLREPNGKAPRKGEVNPAIAFIGGYGHPPNVDAAQWAAETIMPLVRPQVQGVELLLVGSRMPTEVSSLAAKDIVPLGFVPSLDSVFERVRLTIAPLRFGAGLKGKVLESMAAGVPCVMTPVAAEGLDLPEELAWLVADQPDLLADRIAKLCRDNARYERVAKACVEHVAANYAPERIDALIRQACGRE